MFLENFVAFVEGEAKNGGISLCSDFFHPAASGLAHAAAAAGRSHNGKL